MPAKKKSSSANSPKSSKNRRATPKKPGLGPVGQEVVGLILLAFTVLLFMGIKTYVPGDIPSSAGDQVKNVMGWVGAYGAYGLFTAFGVTSYLVPCLIFITSMFFFVQRPLRLGIKEILGLILFFGFSSSIFDLYYDLDTMVLGIRMEHAGGWVGNYINHQALKPLLGKNWGTYLVSVTGMVASFMVFTRFSFVKFFAGAASLLARMGGGVLRYFQQRPQRTPTSPTREKPVVSVTPPPPKKEKKDKGKFFFKEKTTPAEEKIESPAAPPPSPPPPEPVITRMENKKETRPFIPGAGALRESDSSKGEFVIPPLSLLEEPVRVEHKNRDEELRLNSRILMEKLQDFGVQGRISKVCPGPVITRYEFEPAPGVKINKVANLADDLALAMSALSVRIVAPIPGRSVVGIEIPNHHRETIYLKEIMDCSKYRAAQKKSKLSLVLGQDIAGTPVVTDLGKMPHLLIAGSTGSGKSVSLNGIILSLLYNATPDELKMIMIDPKMLELGIYNGIPHHMIPTVTDPKKASLALAWAIEEMENRYCLLADRGVRNIDQYNHLMDKKRALYTEDEMGENHHKKLPFIVLVIDEFADLMMTSSKEVEGYITRLAQMARAVGIHLIIATQRPSVDVITGLIKANFPSRISFRVSSRVDSRTILDCMGSEKLLGMGDMLFLPPGASNLERIHGPLVTETEIRRIVKFLTDQAKPEYDYSIIASQDDRLNMVAGNSKNSEEYDDVYKEAIEFVIQKGQASTSMIQRRFKIGYNRAANIIEVMEREGIVGPADGSRPRDVLIMAHPD